MTGITTIITAGGTTITAGGITTVTTGGTTTATEGSPSPTSRTSRAETQARRSRSPAGAIAPMRARVYGVSPTPATRRTTPGYCRLLPLTTTGTTGMVGTTGM